MRSGADGARLAQSLGGLLLRGIGSGGTMLGALTATGRSCSAPMTVVLG